MIAPRAISDAPALVNAIVPVARVYATRNEGGV